MITINRRTTYDIIFDILDLCRDFGGYSKSRIDQLCDLSDRNYELIEKLNDLGLLEKIDSKGTSAKNNYKTTYKGHRYLLSFVRIRHILKIDDNIGSLRK